jgi:hypothetical protein
MNINFSGTFNAFHPYYVLMPLKNNNVQQLMPKPKIYLLKCDDECVKNLRVFKQYYQSASLIS